MRQDVDILALHTNIAEIKFVVTFTINSVSAQSWKGMAYSARFLLSVRHIGVSISGSRTTIF